MLLDPDEAGRSWPLPTGTDWEALLRYVLARWTSGGVRVVGCRATLTTDRDVSALSVDELLQGVGPLRSLLERVFVTLDLSEFEPVKKSLLPALLGKDLQCFVAVNIPSGDPDAMGGSLFLHVESASLVASEGIVAALGSAVGEWVKANAAPSAPDSTSVEQAPAPAPLEPITPTAPTETQMPTGSRMALSGITGFIFGATLFSVLVFGFDKAASPAMLGLSAAVLVAILVYKFGLNR